MFGGFDERGLRLGVRVENGVWRKLHFNLNSFGDRHRNIANLILFREQGLAPKSGWEFVLTSVLCLA